MADLLIDNLGWQGDGVATVDGKPVFVPFALPGEIVSVSGGGTRREIVKVLKKSPDRIEPSCPHFGRCGGCQTQHLEKQAYEKWKLGLVNSPLEKSGITHPVVPMITFENHSRRRCVFNVRNTNNGVLLGYTERASNTIIPIETCPVLVPEIVESLEDIRRLASSLPQTRKPFRLSVLVTKNGLDIDIEGAVSLKSEQKAVLIRKALSTGFARISSDHEILVEKRKPILQMGQCELVPPPGVFIQALEAAEREMTGLVCEHFSNCKTMADLYSGIGTFALRLAENSTVWAVEENKTALQALDRAWRETGGKLKQIKTEARNLDRRPVGFQEMKKIDGLVFDPPRSGAEAQARQIAKSKVGKVAAVSCNPQTLARDLAILTAGGYFITRIVPLDQFRYTPHVEVVVLLQR
ncbi:MAG: class I SAM-dependent RNA methyltransferase [Rhizobiaceae bacterium]